MKIELTKEEWKYIKFYVDKDLYYKNMSEKSSFVFAEIIENLNEKIGDEWKDNEYRA